MDADVVAAALEFMGEVALAAGDFREGAGKVRAAFNKLAGEDFHDDGGEDVEAEEAEVVPGAESGNDEFLLGLGGSGFFDDRLDLIEQVAASQAASADGSVERELALVGGLNGGDGAFFGSGGGEELSGAGGLGAAQIEVVADHEQKRIIARESGGAVNGVGIAEGFRLLDETHVAGVRASGFSVGGLVAGTDDDGDFLDAGGSDFVGKDGEGGS